MNKDTSKIYKNLPLDIKILLNISEGWLVGSSPEQLIKGEHPKDFDIIVPNTELYQKALLHIYNTNASFRLNTCGGMKFVATSEHDSEIDIWCQSLESFLFKAKNFTYVFNLKNLILIKNV